MGNKRILNCQCSVLIANAACLIGNAAFGAKNMFNCHAVGTEPPDNTPRALADKRRSALLLNLTGVPLLLSDVPISAFVSVGSALNDK